jgi:hypothetical protein
VGSLKAQPFLDELGKSLQLCTMPKSRMQLVHNLSNIFFESLLFRLVMEPVEGTGYTGVFHSNLQSRIMHPPVEGEFFVAVTRHWSLC